MDRTDCPPLHFLYPLLTIFSSIKNFLPILPDPKGDDKVLKAACGDVTDDDDDDDEMEEMFVNADASFAHTEREWGGPRRGGRLPEPTRFGDWERKGRCTDF